MEKYLLGTCGNYNRQKIPIKEEIIMGRDSGVCQLVFGASESEISGVHCKIQNIDGVIQVTDMGSTNGTFLETGVRLKPYEPQMLTDKKNISRTAGTDEEQEIEVTVQRTDKDEELTENTENEAEYEEQPGIMFEQEEPEYEEERSICPRCGEIILVDVEWKVPVATDEINAKMEAMGSTPLEYFNPAEHDYQLLLEDVTWEEAKLRCEQMGGHLATITCKEEIEKIEEYLSRISADQKDELHIWLGTKCYGRNLEGYCSLRGVVDGEDLGISNWYPGEPTHYDMQTGEEELYLCMFYSPGTSENGNWVWLDVPNDISPLYGGRIAYLCEWEHVVANK